MEPEMSHSTTSERGSRICRRQTHDRSWPPVPRFRRNIARGASRRPCEWSSYRRVRRRSSRGTRRSTSRSASRSSAGVIRSNSRWRRTSPCEYASGEMITPSIGASSSSSPSSDGIGTPRSSGDISVRSWPASGGAAPGASSSRSASSSCFGSVEGLNSSEKREPRRRHQRSKAASYTTRSSRRRTKTAAPAAFTCSRSEMSTSVRARAKSTAAPMSIARCAARSERPNPTASPSRRRPSISAPKGERTMAGSVTVGILGPVSRRRRPRRDSDASRRRGPGGCPPRT